MRVIAIALIAALWTRHVSAQSGAIGPCVNCKIELLPTTQLGTDTDPGFIPHIESRVTRDHRGNYIVKGNYATTLLVFDSTGRFLRTIGRAGSGPGEFRGIGSIAVGAADSLVVFEQESRRYTLLDANWKYVSSNSLPLGPELTSLMLPTGEFVFGLPLRSAAQRGQPLHVVDRSGRIAPRRRTS